MRKLIATFLLLSFNSYAVPPVAVNGEQQANAYVQNIKTPNSQTTSLGGIDTRIESGNTNLLVNPSFEHSTVTTGWTVTNATGSANLTDMVEGKKDLSLALTAAMTVTQDSTVNAANLVGLQGVASIKIKSSDVTGLKVCARNAGVTSTALCVNVVADGTWKHVIIPFIMTATSNGIAITSTGITGTVKIDDAFVGTSSPFQGLVGAKLVGTAVVTGCAGDWTVTNTALTLPAAQTGCSYAVTGSATAPSTLIPAITFASLPAGDYRIEYEGFWGVTTSTAQTVCAQFSDGTNTARELSCAVSGGGASTVRIPTISQTISYTTAQSNVTFSTRLKSSSGAAVMSGSTANTGTFKVYYSPPESRIYSQASQDYDWVAYTPTFGAGFGAVSAPNCFQQRRGHNLEVKCFPTSGTTAVAVGSITLPTGLEIDSGIIKATNTTAAAGQHVGEYQAAAGSGNNSWIVTALGTNTSAVYVAGTFAGSSSLIPSANIGGILGNSTLFSVKFTVPISGWSDYGTIVGSFAGIEKCENDYECTDTFSADVSITGVVSNENLNWINGNGSYSAGVTTLTYNSNLKDGATGLVSPMNCEVTSYNGNVNAVGQTSTTTALTVLTQISSTLAPGQYPFKIQCQKGTNDYKPKTAKVASSIGVPTVPGLAGTTTAVDTFSASYGATATTACTAPSTACAYLDQIGTVVTSITRNASAGIYTMNLGKTYSQLKCTATVANGTSSRQARPMRCESCSSLVFNTQDSATTPADTQGTLICQGTY
jgi:hypothetical protein